jgi:two-component system nitrate/nitrite response regulator NarL
MTARQTSLIIVDDHPVVRHGLINLLVTEIDFIILATCANGLEGIQAMRSLTPDIAVVDMSMPKMTGLDVLAAAAAENLSTRIIVLAGAPDDREIIAAADGGAFGFVLKDAAGDELLSCLRCVARGEKWLPAALIDNAQVREKDRQSERAMVDSTLSRREREVMLLIGENLSNKEAGQRLHLSEGTVKLHLHSIFSKLGLRNRTALAALAARYERATGLSERPRAGTRPHPVARETGLHGPARKPGSGRLHREPT